MSMFRRRLLIQASKLPIEYQQVEYLESDGTQSVNTGVNPCMNSIRCTCDMMPVSNGDSAFFGSRGTYYLFYWVDNNYFWPTSKCETIEGTLSINTKYHVDWNKGILEVTGNGIYQKGIRKNSTQDTIPMYIFDFNPNADRKRGSHARVYYFNIDIDDKPVRRFIPCYRKSDNITGFYDKVTNTFFPSNKQLVCGKLIN